MLPIDFEQLMNSGDEDQDIYIRPGDYIHIASNLRNIYAIDAENGGIEMGESLGL